MCNIVLYIDGNLSFGCGYSVIVSVQSSMSRSVIVSIRDTDSTEYSSVEYNY